MDTIILKRIDVEGTRVDYSFQASGKLRKYFRGNNRLFFQYNHDVADVPLSILAIPFVANVIPLAWLMDSTVVVEELDESFFLSLDPIKAAYQAMFKAYPFKGEIQTKRTVRNTYEAQHEAAALFSGGLDALTTFVRIKEQRPWLVTEYGWHEEDIKPSEVWEADKGHAVQFAASNGLSNILIESNYGTFLHAAEIDYDYSRKLGDSWWHGLHHGLAIISAAIPIAYKLKIKRIYIASSNTAGYPVPCASDPTVDNEIKYASGKVYHDGFELSRQDKVKAVVDHYSAVGERVNIRVCFKNEENCCNCEKCLRTIMGIVAEGHSPRAYGFKVPDNLSAHLERFLRSEVKFFTPTFISIYWIKIQQRMKENAAAVADRKLLEWFPEYNFKRERRRALIRYRTTRFFPIIKRKITTQLKRIREKTQ